MKVIKSENAGFCFGVRRAIDMLEKAVSEHGDVDCLGAVVHNEKVTQKLQEKRVNFIQSIDDIRQKCVAISSHGVSLQTEAGLRAKADVIDTTCPFVKRAQLGAQRMSEEGLFVVIFGDPRHPEVIGILGHSQGDCLATLNLDSFKKLDKIPRCIGVLSQTTQVPDLFARFIKELLDASLKQNAEIRILDTICPDVRKRQTQSIDLANKVDLLLVVGGHSSANTRRLEEICSTITETHLVSDENEINPGWLSGKKKIGITSGTSTPDETIDEIVSFLKNYSSRYK